MICKKIRSKLFLLSKVKCFLPFHARKLFFNSYILPHFDFCLSLWGWERDNHFNRLNVLHRKAMRLILGVQCYSDMTSVDMLKKLGWFPLKYRRKFKVVQMVYKALNNMSPPYISNMLCLESSTKRATRSSSDYKLQVPFSRCKFGDFSFRATGPRCFNELPSSIRCLPTYKSFTSACYKYYMNSFIRDN